MCHNVHVLGHGPGFVVEHDEAMLGGGVPFRLFITIVSNTVRRSWYWVVCLQGRGVERGDAMLTARVPPSGSRVTQSYHYLPLVMYVPISQPEPGDV
jgi:hypothetical protein